ncbi:MAG: class I SAM-dependent methyltransferase [Anaerolineae bacterium]|nr:class I SAM-dependent methyltransferase [Anaerolineae bacterium]
MSENAKWKVSGTGPEIYEQVFVPAVMQTWANRLVDLANARPGIRILDVACGSGVVTRKFAERNGNSGQIIGFDINPDMIAIAQVKQPSSIIEWREGNVLELPFQDSTFDIVTCQHGLMFFEDRVKGLQEMYRVLVPGGSLVVLVWGPIEDNAGFLAAAEGFGRHVGIEAGDSIRGMFVLGDLGRMRSLAKASGFRDVDVKTVAAQAHFPSVEDLVHGFGALMQSAISEAIQLELLTDIATTLRPYVNDDGLVFPMEAIVMHVRK